MGLEQQATVLQRILFRRIIVKNQERVKEILRFEVPDHRLALRLPELNLALNGPIRPNL